MEIIHRVTNDPTLLPKFWFEGVIASGLAETVYVEIVAVIGIVHSVDVFCRTLDIGSRRCQRPFQVNPPVFGRSVQNILIMGLPHWCRKT